MPEQIKINRPAFNLLTTPQRDAIIRLVGADHTIEVYTQFDLPTGYLGFKLTYNSGHDIYGGIDPDGSVST